MIFRVAIRSSKICLIKYFDSMDTVDWIFLICRVTYSEITINVCALLDIFEESEA